jgi:4-hydroxyphenylpyruvate dioxygenase
VNAYGIGTVCLGGNDLAAKLRACHGAGCDGVSICHDDLHGALARPLRDALGGRRVLAIEPLRNFAGVTGQLRTDARTHAAAFLAEARFWAGPSEDDPAPAVLVCSSTHPATNPELITADLRQLCEWAALTDTPIWYEALPWGWADRTLADAYRRVLAVNMPNFYVVVDVFHHFLTGGDPSLIGLVQLSDLIGDIPDIYTMISTARNERELCGTGWMTRPTQKVVGTLLDKGYTGPIAAEVMNRGLRADDPHTAARKIMHSLGRVAPIYS